MRPWRPASGLPGPSGKRQRAAFAPRQPRTKRNKTRQLDNISSWNLEGCIAGERFSFELKRTQNFVVTRRQLLGKIRRELQALARQQPLRLKSCFSHQASGGVQN